MTSINQIKGSLVALWRASSLYYEGLSRAQRAYWSVAPTPNAVVAQRGRARLLCYHSDKPNAVPLLIIPSLIGRYYLFDLLSKKSFVSFFARHGFNVYLVDWGDPGLEDRELLLGDHISIYVAYLAKEVLRISRQERLSLVGYSLGGVMAASYAALHPEKVRSLALLSTPIDFSLSGVGCYVRAGARPIEAMLSTFGEMPSWALQGGFHWLTPASFWSDAARLMHSEDHASKEEAAALQRWLQEGVSIPAGTFREIVQTLYFHNSLLQGKLHVAGEIVSLKNIQSPTLLITADKDYICPPMSSLALRGKTSGTVESIAIEGAHTAAAVHAADSLWPRLATWIHSQQASPKRLP
jgi:polyhydroxyalkanoate synthase subunit PhaC